MDITKNPAWASPLAGSSWVSTASTGNPSAPGYVVFPNGTNILFAQSFFLDGLVDSASLSVLADDTANSLQARVLTQEHQLYPQAIAQLLQKI